MPVIINGETWTFVSVRGVQVVIREGVARTATAVCDHDENRVSIADAEPIGEQLEGAALAGIAVYKRSRLLPMLASTENGPVTDHSASLHQAPPAPSAAQNAGW